MMRGKIGVIWLISQKSMVKVKRETNFCSTYFLQCHAVVDALGREIHASGK